MFVADVKGDLAGPRRPRRRRRARGAARARHRRRWRPAGFPVEFLSLTGKLGAQLRATVSSFGPLLLGKVLGLNDTQTSVLSLVFKYCDDRGLLLLDFTDLRAVLSTLSGRGRRTCSEYGGMSKATVGVLLREMVELEQQGAEAFFGEPEFDLDDLMRAAPDGRGLVSVLELSDVQDRPALFSTFMMWMLARLYHQLPEVGDLRQAQAGVLLRRGAPAVRRRQQGVPRPGRAGGAADSLEGRRHLLRHAEPEGHAADVLGQLGNRVQHALRAFTPDDDKALRAAARTFPKTPFYDIEETLTTLGIGEAFVTVLATSGVPDAARSSTRIAPTRLPHGPARRPPSWRRCGARSRCGGTRPRSTARAPTRSWARASRATVTRDPPRPRRPRRNRRRAPRSESAWSEALRLAGRAHESPTRSSRNDGRADVGKPPRRRARRSAW